MEKILKSAATPLTEQSNALTVLQDFVIREARLMDTHQFDDWLDIWDDDALYWAPCNSDDVDPKSEVSIIYESNDGLAQRVKRLRGKFAHSQRPQSRLTRVVSNFELDEVTEDQISGYSNFVLGEIRVKRQSVLFGRNHHVLRMTDGGLKLKQKKVVLLNNDEAMGNLTFLI